MNVYGDEAFPAHNTLLKNKILLLESLNNLDILPPRAYFFALPLNIKEGSASPIRPIAFFEKI